MEMTTKKGNTLMQDETDIREQMERLYSGEGRKFSRLPTLSDDYDYFLDLRLRHLASRFYKSQFSKEPSSQY